MGSNSQYQAVVSSIKKKIGHYRTMMAARYMIRFSYLRGGKGVRFISIKQNITVLKESL